MREAQQSERVVERHDPLPEPVMHDPHVGSVRHDGAPMGLRNPDPDKEYAWVSVNRTGLFSANYFRKTGYEIERYSTSGGGLNYEYSDPLRPPKNGDPIVDDDLVLMSRTKAKGEDVRENGFRVAGGQAGGMATRRKYEEVRASIAGSDESTPAFVKVGPHGELRGSLPI